MSFKKVSNGDLMKKKWKRIGSILFVVLAVVMLMEKWSSHLEREDEMTVEMSENEKEDAVCSQLPPLVKFGRYIEQVCREGRRAELDQYVISEELSLEEAALLAGEEPIMRYIKGYAEDYFTVPTNGGCMISADVNGDGIEDLIEYGPANSRAMSGWQIANRLVIYLGTEDGGYELTYFQPVFDTRVEWSDIIEVLQYEGEAYLLFCDWREQYAMTVYWLSEGIPCGRLTSEYQCIDMGIEIIKNEGDIDVDRLMDRGMDLYHVMNGFHCNCGAWDAWLKNGSAEVEATDERYTQELCDKYGKKNMDELNELLKERLKEYGEDLWTSVPNGDSSDSFASDIDNDGVKEEYVKQTGQACIWGAGMPNRGLYRYYDILFGEDGWRYNGRHGGKSRLFYYMETSGEETDFMKMCGLDIWEGGMIPQNFFVEETPKGNITYIVYQDINEFEQQIEGYLIKEGTYEHVVSIKCTPVLELSSHYEFKEKDRSGRVDYITYLAEDCKSVNLKWIEENELEEQVNQNIRSMIGEKMADINWEENRFFILEYYPVKATNEGFMMDYCIFYKVPWYDDVWEGEHTETYSMEVNLITGECRELESEERSEMNQEDCKQW